MPIGGVMLIVMGVFVGINLLISHEEMKDIPSVQQSAIYEVASAKVGDSAPYEYGAGKSPDVSAEAIKVQVLEPEDSSAPAQHPLADKDGIIPAVGDPFPNKPSIIEWSGTSSLE